jgi:hypothetical protein
MPNDYANGRSIKNTMTYNKSFQSLAKNMNKKKLKTWIFFLFCQSGSVMAQIDQTKKLFMFEDFFPYYYLIFNFTEIGKTFLDLQLCIFLYHFVKISYLSLVQHQLRVSPFLNWTFKSSVHQQLTHEFKKKYNLQTVFYLNLTRFITIIITNYLIAILKRHSNGLVDSYRLPI